MAKSTKSAKSATVAKSAKSTQSASPAKPAADPRPPKPSSYCEAVSTMEKDNVHVHYHDNEYGFPIDDDNLLFARLVLEINQAGLSWTTILRKKDNFFLAFDNFDIAIVARYKQKQIDRLLADAGIIRNRLKVEAAIENARRIQTIQKEYGTFKAWLDHHHPLTKPEWSNYLKTLSASQVVRSLGNF